MIPALTARQWIGYAGLALVFLLVAAVAVWRGDILQAGLDPQVPFQTYQPPPAPDYDQAEAWHLLDARTPDAGPAAVFFVHPTSFDGGRHWNAPLHHPAADRWLNRVVVPNHVGAFARAGAVSAPRYRQASLYTRLTLRPDARDARAFAYRDILAAFEAWLARHPDGPLVLAGVEQGAELLDRLLRERVATDPAVAPRVVAVYLIDALVARDRLPSAFPPCAGPQRSGCVVAWSEVGEGDDAAGWRRLRRALIWDDAGHLVELDDREPVCVNPVSGAANDQRTEARQHAGGANATGLEWGARPAFIDRHVSAQCRGGLLRYSSPRSETFRRSGSWTERRKSSPYNLFYADLEADVLRRMSVWSAGAGANPRPDAPSASRTGPPEPARPFPAR